MIDRYSLPEISRIWSDENRFSIWLEIELYALEALAEQGIVPEKAVIDLREKGRFEVKRILEIEAEVKHDVIAFLTNIAEHMGENSRYVHYGMTSSDVLDTALAVQMKQAGELIREKLNALIDVLKKRALETKDFVMIGRSHGVHAEPTTFGLKMALWYDECRRQLVRLNDAIETISVGQVSGAVGTYDHIDPAVEAHVCRRLGLKPANISTQILQRDRHACYMQVLALIGATLEKIAVEIRHLQRTEVLEAEEYFSSGQKGSSAMPHKKNPIVCERITGMARILRANAHAAMENIALWHERDISHSSVERIIVPDSTMALYYMLVKAVDLIGNLVVHPENMQTNLEKTKGLYYSQAVLLALTRKGVSREQAYRMVQRNAMKVWEKNLPFAEVLTGDEELTALLPPDEISAICNLKNRLSRVDAIFKKTGLL